VVKVVKVVNVVKVVKSGSGVLCHALLNEKREKKIKERETIIRKR